MGEKTSRLKRLGHFFLDTVVHSIFGVLLHPLWLWAWGAALSAIIALVAKLQDRDPWFYVAVGFFSLFAVLTLSSAILRFIKHRNKKKPQTGQLKAELVKAEQEPPTSDKLIARPEKATVEHARPALGTDAAERLRELHYFADRAFVYGAEYLFVDLRADALSSGSTELNIISELLERWLRHDYESYRDRLAGLTEHPRVDPRDDIVGLWQRCISNYLLAGEWIRRVGTLLHSSDYVNTAGYVELYARHDKLIENLAPIEKRRDIHGIAWNIRELRAMLPPPRGSADRRLEDVFGSGLELVHHRSTHEVVRGRQAHLHLFKVRIHAAAAAVLFQCRDPLHYATAQMAESPTVYPTINWRQNWAEAAFKDPDEARGSLLCIELSSVAPLKLEEVAIRSKSMLAPETR